MTTADVNPGAKNRYWWKRRNCDDEWPATPYHRTQRGQACPKCSYQFRSRTKATPKPGESLAEKNPELAAEWHPTLNGSLTPIPHSPGLKPRGTVETMLRRLNPSAKIICTDHGVVPLDAVLDTGLFDPVLAESAPGWDEEIAGGHTPETEEYGISSMTFRATRPFHPQRLELALDALRGVLRSKRFCWIASRPSIAAIWSQAGPNLVIEPAQYWSTADIGPSQEIVFIGVRLDRDRVDRLLESALLTDAELVAGEKQWITYPDPLPSWGVTHSHR